MAVSSGLFVLGAIALLLLRYHQQLVAWLKHRLFTYECMSAIAGPYSIPILGTAWQFKFGRIEFADQLMGWGKEFGPNGLIGVWIGPRPAVIVTRAHTAEVILSSSVEINKSNDYDIFLPWLGYGLLISGGDKWRSRRKMLTPTFHYSILDSFVAVYNRQADTLVKVLANGIADSARTVDMFPYIKRCALDSVAETAMGVTVNAQIDHNSDYVMAVQDMNEIAFRYQRSPWLWLKPLFYAFGYGKRYDNCLRILKGFSSQVITERTAQLRARAAREGKQLSELKTDKKKTAFLDLLLMMSDENRLTQNDIIDEVETFMFEGHDTTSSGMSWALWFLAHNPQYQDKVYEELRDVFGDDIDREILPDDLKQLKYLEMCIKEALRMCPPVPMYARVLTKDVIAGGKTIPAGATTIIVPIVIHRDSTFYPEPDVYNPDNFLPERSSRRHPYAFVPFSAGSRNCIGQKFALMEEKTVLAKLLLHYSVEPMDTMEKVRPLPEIITRPPDGFPVRFHSR